ncbi:Uncharacterised protein [Chromobacterium violaceum]|uniref:DJ-1/PfpI domain-containing protein n=1 Tax=Chromobacterium violaceum TaxID=536 RepID=A0A447TCM8_CHRVL|nr:Uncharacterised protein [Chromobacterium violaceum]
MSPHGWNVRLCAPVPVIQSRSGTRVERQEDLSYANRADAVLIGSGWRTRDWVADDSIMGQLKLDPTRQLIGSQCSGALVLHRLGLLADGIACTDGMTRPLLEQLGVRVQPRPSAPPATSPPPAAACPPNTWLPGCCCAWPARRKPARYCPASRRLARKRTLSGARCPSFPPRRRPSRRENRIAGGPGA